MDLAPIALFVYNRIECTKNLIESLLKNKEAIESDLFIFSDAPKIEEDVTNVLEIRKYINTLNNKFKNVKIIERQENYGLSKNIIEGINYVFEYYDKLIVLEDDLILSEYFLNYINNALILYKDETEVISIHGYLYPLIKTNKETFFIKGADCWGWGTWKNSWALFEHDGSKLLKMIEEKKLFQDFTHNFTNNNIKMLKNQIIGKNSSWAIRWHASAIINRKYTLYPGRSLVRNIGENGTHIKSISKILTDLSTNRINLEKIEIKDEIETNKEFEKFNLTLYPLNRIKRIVNRILNGY